MGTHAAGSGPRHALGGGTGFFVFSVLAVLIVGLLTAAGCTPVLRAVALPPVVPSIPLPTSPPEPCDLPDVDDQVLEAAWAYVHERYPAQPWPDTVYLPEEWIVHTATWRHLTHVVLCSHATGFVWEGEVVWYAPCTCCRVDVDGIRESFVVVAVPAATSTVQP
jgi:hypothetical protein